MTKIVEVLENYAHVVDACLLCRLKCSRRQGGRESGRGAGRVQKRREIT